MTSDLNRRLARLEGREPPPLRQRIVWLDDGAPEPEAGPGEKLIMIKWIWDGNDEPSPCAPSASAEDT
jgi:hypothetical protein